MRRIRIRVVAGLVIALSALSAFAFEWPADAGRFRFGFGAPRGGFLRGVEFGSADGLVTAADDGELTFSAQGPRLPGGYPLVAGSLVVVAHASSMTTVYAGLKPGSVSSYLKNVRKGDVLGRSSEAKDARGVSFYTFDAKERRFINPMIVMPSVSDDKPPVIRSMALSLEADGSYADQSKPIRQGSYYVVVDAYDLSPSGSQSSPFDLRVLIDGSERGRMVYDAAWAADGRATLFGGVGVEEGAYLVADGRVRFGPFSLSRGRVLVTVAASDYASNRREQTYSISVQ
ncbi:MAG: peptidoglycan DD-metalloendopeptidase family protein [Spirochaetes bacterium]|nr:peptidoglycan DD-metalloendopeptidase family protein [Spirochaetota bacterium]MBU1080272.1 peptidoglycan DD-metalloendopeptidase family protein [Spirochaetota bacterium]